jgi:hypothetical protein
MKVSKIILIVLAVMISITGIFYLMGHFASREFKGTVTQKVEASPISIWDLLNDIDGLPSRRKEITKVERMGKNEKGFERWKEHTDMGGYMVFEITELIPKEKMVVEMKESTFGMSGTWTYQLNEEGNATVVTVTEDSNTDNVWLRSIMTLAGRDANLKIEVEKIEEGVKKN